MRVPRAMRRHKFRLPRAARWLAVALVITNVVSLHVLWIGRSRSAASVGNVAPCAAVVVTNERKERLAAPIEFHAKLPQTMESQRDRFLFFRGGGRGQGIGNIMNGLIATHLLAERYNRTCCVAYWPSFSNAFSRNTENACLSLASSVPTKQLSLWNFGSGKIDKECWSVGSYCDLLLKGDEAFIKITGNEYPFDFFPPLPVGLFDRLYTPSEHLRPFLLPRKSLPTTVVHIRAGDNSADKRTGVDADSQMFLIQFLPKDAFVITNNEIIHKRFVTAGFRSYHAPVGQVHTSVSGNSDVIMHAWRDWYTIFKADVVLHTPSAFSESAVRASGSFSRRIKDYDARDAKNLSAMLQIETWQ